MFKYIFLATGIMGLQFSQSSGAVAFCPDILEKAKNVPAQLSLGHESSWSCGPNSLARFLILSGYDFNYQDKKSYTDFMTSCPRSFGRPATAKGYVSCASASMVSLFCLCYGWDGYSDILSGLFLGAAAITPFVIEEINKCLGMGKVGPTPKWLVGYGNQVLEGKSVTKRIVAKKLSDENLLIENIKADLNKSEPLIVLVNLSPLCWHYVTIIEFDEQNDEFIYLETNGSVNSISRKRLVEYMDFDKEAKTKAIKCALETLGTLASIDIGRFNLIQWADNKSKD